VLKGPADGAPVPAVRKWFHFWKKPA